MKQPVGIIQDPRGHPVRQDPLGTPAEVKAGPYLLDDGVSLEAPIPVVIVTGNSYVDSAGNLRGVWPMNITGLSSWSPLDLFEDGTYTGRLYDFKKSRMWSDDGVTLATAGQSVQRIEDLTGAGDATQATSSFRGILQDDGTVLTDGLDDWYDTGMNMTNDGTIQLYALVDVLGPLTAIGCFVGARTSDTARNFIYVQNNRPIVVIGGTSWDYLSDGPLVGTTCGLGQGSSQSTRVVHLNGQLMTGLKPNLVARGTSKIYIGAVPGSPPTGYAQIRLRLVLIINRLLTDAEAAQLQAYGTS